MRILRGGGPKRTAAARSWTGAALVVPALWAGCSGEALETRTFEVRYLHEGRAEALVSPYVFGDRERNPGRMSSVEGALTVRETEDNLERIARVLEEYDRPRPTVMLHFQIIEADGATAADPAIADVERELRRLFRFEGYDLVAETQVAGVAGTGVRQLVGEADSDEGFLIEGGVSEVRGGSERTTVTLDVRLSAMPVGRVLETSVTVPIGHSVVLGTAQTPGYEGALILVVRAELLGEEGEVGGSGRAGGSGGG